MTLAVDHHTRGKLHREDSKCLFPVYSKFFGPTDQTFYDLKLGLYESSYTSVFYVGF